MKLSFHLVKKSNYNTLKNLLELCFHLLSSFLILFSGDFVELWALWIKIDSRVFTFQEDKTCARCTMTKNTWALASATQAVGERLLAQVEWNLIKFHVPVSSCGYLGWNYRVNCHSYNSSLFDPSDKTPNIGLKDYLVLPYLESITIRSKDAWDWIMKFTPITLAYYSSVPPGILKIISFYTVFVSSRWILYGVECVQSPPGDHNSINIYNKLISKNEGMDWHNFYTKTCFQYSMNEHISNINQVVIAK